MIGNWSVLIHAVKPYTIHGDLYYELHVQRLDEPSDNLFALRVPQHAVTGQPQLGDRLAITFLMGQVTGTKKLDEKSV